MNFFEKMSQDACPKENSSRSFKNGKKKYYNQYELKNKSDEGKVLN